MRFPAFLQNQFASFIQKTGVSEHRAITFRLPYKCSWLEKMQSSPALFPYGGFCVSVHYCIALGLHCTSCYNCMLSETVLPYLGYDVHLVHNGKSQRPLLYVMQATARNEQMDFHSRILCGGWYGDTPASRPHLQHWEVLRTCGYCISGGNLWLSIGYDFTKSYCSSRAIK